MGFDSVSVELEPSPEDLLTCWGLEISEKNLEHFFPKPISHDLAAEAALGGLSQGVGLVGENLDGSRSGICFHSPQFLCSGHPQNSEELFKAEITPDRSLPFSVPQGNYAPFVSTGGLEDIVGCSGFQFFPGPHLPRVDKPVGISLLGRPPQEVSVGFWFPGVENVLSKVVPQGVAEDLTPFVQNEGGIPFPMRDGVLGLYDQSRVSSNEVVDLPPKSSTSEN